MGTKTVNRHHFRQLCLLLAAGITSTLVIRCASRKYISSDDFVLPILFKAFENPTRVTIGNESNYGPSLSPNGAYMFYTSDRTGNKDLFVKKTRGGYAVPLTSHPADDFSPVMSPDGSMLAFVSRRTNAAGSIHVMKIGQSISKLSGQIEGDTFSINLPDLELRNPAWFPKGDKIVFSGRGPGERIPRIYTAKVAESPDIIPLDGIRGDYPTVSHAGGMIAYSRSGALFLFQPGQKKEIKLTTGETVQDGHPQFTPDDKGLAFIRYADDTNDDGKIDANDRPTIWSLDIERQKSEPENLENFSLKALSSAQFAAFYPQVHRPYIYFASQDSDSLDIYRLPESGHTKFHKDLNATVNNFEQLDDEHNKTYLLRHDTSEAFIAKNDDLASKLALLELEWLTDIERHLEAKWLAAKIARNFHENVNVLAAASLITIEGALSPWRYPSNENEISEDARHQMKQWQKVVSGILDDAQKTTAISDDTKALAFYVSAELTATMGDPKQSEALLTRITSEFASRTQIASKALYYRAKLETVRGEHDLALNTTIEMITKFPKERTRAISASLDITTAVPISDRGAIKKLTHIRDLSDKVIVLPAYAQHRMIAVWRHQGKQEAANAEMRALIKRAEGSPVLALEAAEELVGIEDEAGRQSSALGIIKELRPLLSKSDPEIKKRLSLLEVSLHVRRGRAHLTAGEIGFGVREFKAALAVWPTDLGAQVGLIDAKEQGGELESAVADYQRLVTGGSNNSDILYLLAYAKQKQAASNPKERLTIINDSLELLENARQINGHVSQYHLLLGKLYLEKAHIRRTELDSTSGMSKMSRAFTQFKNFLGFPESNWFELSIDSSLTAFYLSPPKSVEQADLSLQMGDTYFENQNYHLSLRHYIKRVQMLATVPLGDIKKEMRLYRHAGRAAFYAQELELAATLQRKAYQLAKASGNTFDISFSLDSMALTLRDSHKYAETREIYDELLKLQVKNNDLINATNTHVNLGYTHFMLSNFAQALQEYSLAESAIAALDYESFKQNKDTIIIDIGGQNSAALGFTKADRLIQIASFKAQIFETTSDYENALTQLTKKASLLNEKLGNGKKLGFTGAYMAEELAICHNNIGNLQNRQGNLTAATTSFATSLEFAKKLRVQGQLYPARPEWLGLLNLARNQLQRADLKTISNDERAKIERDIDDALAQFETPLKQDNREAMLAVAALKGVSAQLMSVDALPADGRYAQAQTRFQDSIVLAQKLGIEPNFQKSANLNLDRQTAESRADKDDIFAAYLDFRKGAMLNPGLSWKYLASQGLCHQAIASVANFVSVGAHIPDNDLNLVKHCVDSTLDGTFARKSKAQPDKNAIRDSFESLRRFYYIMAQSYVNETVRQETKQTKSEQAVKVKELFTLGRFERLGASLEPKDGLLIVRPGSSGLNLFLLFSSEIFAKRTDKTEKPGIGSASSPALAQMFEAAIKKTERLYIVTDDGGDILAEPALKELLKGKTRSFLPAPDLLPKLANIRPVGAIPEILPAGQKNSIIWKGYLDRLIAGSYGIVALSNKLADISVKGLPDKIFETLPHIAISGADEDAIIIGYMGPSRSEVQDSGKRLALNALSDAENSLAEKDFPSSQMYAKEAYSYSVTSGDKETRYNSATLVVDSILKSGQGEGLAYFKEKQKLASIELNKAHPLEKDLDAAEVEAKRRNTSEARKLINDLEGDIAKSKDQLLKARYLQIKGEVFAQELQFAEASKALSAASEIYTLKKAYAAAARTSRRLATLYSKSTHDFKEATIQLVVSEGLYKKANDQRGYFEASITRARLLMNAGQLTAADNLINSLTAETSKGFSITDQIEVKFLKAELAFLRGEFRASREALSEIQKPSQDIASIEKRKTANIRIARLKGWLLAAQDHKNDAIAAFNEAILDAKKYRDSHLEREIRLDVGQLSRHWGDMAQSGSHFEVSVALAKAETIESPGDDELSVNLNNYALSLLFAGDLPKAKILVSEASSSAKKNGDKVLDASSQLVMADIALAENNSEQTLRHLNSALSMLNGISAPDVSWRIQYGLGILAVLSKQPEKASEYFSAAIDIARDLSNGPRQSLTSSDSISGVTFDDLRFALAQSLISSNKPEKALVILEGRRAQEHLTFKANSSEPGKELGAKALRSSLPGNTKIVEFFVRRKIITAFVISADDIKAKILDLRSADISSLIEASKQTNKVDRDKAIKDLSSGLTEPLAAEVAGAEHLILIAGEELRDLPFAALSCGGKALIDVVRVLTFAPAASFEKTESVEKGAQRQGLRLLASLSTDSKDSFFKKERSTITRFFPEAQILDGKSANLAALQGELGEEDILHISATGTSNRLDPKSSYLQLYPASSEANQLQVKEITSKPTKRKLTILTQASPSEAFTCSFLTQGTKAVIANTGKSGDTSSLFLTKSFYKNYLAGKNPCDSLRQAQLTTRKYFPADLTWANFRIYGACE